VERSRPFKLDAQGDRGGRTGRVPEPKVEDRMPDVDAEMTAEQCNAKGNQALGVQDFVTAAQYYSAGLERDTKKDLHPVLLSNRSSAYAHSGQWTLALNDADSCMQLRPTWPRGHACRGAALEGMDRLPEALAAFKAAQKLSPSNP